MDEEKKVKHVRMSSNIENLVTEGKKCLLPGMDKDSVSTELFVRYHLDMISSICDILYLLANGLLFEVGGFL